MAAPWIPTPVDGAVLPEKPLSQAEVWDDSVLISTWDDALAEYKKYHSIAATGADADALMQAMDDEYEKKSGPKARQDPQDYDIEDADAASPVNPEEIELVESGDDEQEKEVPETIEISGKPEPEAQTSVAEAVADEHTAEHSVPRTDAVDVGEDKYDPSVEIMAEIKASASDDTAAGAANAGETDALRPQPPLPPMLQNFVVGGNDEAMRNLMMSWYWAGYYTGYYEGQQSAGTTKQE